MGALFLRAYKSLSTSTRPCPAAAGFGTIESYLFVMLQEMGGTKLLMGITLTSESQQ